MKRINISTQATIVEVKNTVHAKRGDYLMVSDDGHIVAISGQMYRALSVVSDEMDPPRTNGRRPDLKMTARQAEIMLDREKIREQVLDFLGDGCKTANDIMCHILGEYRKNRDYYNAVYRVIDRLYQDKVIEGEYVDDDDPACPANKRIRLYAKKKEAATATNFTLVD